MEIYVGTTEELQLRGRKLVAVGDREIGVFYINGNLFAYENVCLHQGGPVCLGVLMPKVVAKYGDGMEYLGDEYSNDVLHLVCPWHGVEYNVFTGQCASERTWRLRAFPVEVREGKVYVLL